MNVSDNSSSGKFVADTLTIVVLWCLFAVAAFGFSPIPGINEPHYLAKARAFWEPDWCTKDFFLQSANAHYVFYLIVGPLTRVLSLSGVAIIGRLVSMLIFAFGWHRLARSLGLTTAATVFAATAFVCFSHVGNFSGEWILGGFESKVPACGFVLLSISLLADLVSNQSRSTFRASVLAGLCLGLATSLHPVVGGWSMLATSAGLCLSMHVSMGEWFKRLLIVNGVATVAALPGLIPALQFLLRSDVPKSDADLANFYQVFWRLRHHLDPMEIPRSGWQWLLFISTIFGLLTLIQRWTRTRLSPVNGAQGQAYRYLCLVLFASLLIAAAGVVIGWHNVPATELKGWQWRASLLKFYPFRLFDAFLPITTAMGLGLLMDSIRALRLGAGTAAASSEKQHPGWGLNVMACLCATASLVWVWSDSSSIPAGYTKAQADGWRSACDWIRVNTPADALFLTPRESSAFKWYAERAEYVCYKDCPQDARGILEWNRRLWFLHDWTLQSSHDNLYSRAELQKLRAETGITHVVTRILGPFEDAPLHRPGDWMIIAIPEPQ